MEEAAEEEEDEEEEDEEEDDEAGTEPCQVPATPAAMDSGATSGGAPTKQKVPVTWPQPSGAPIGEGEKRQAF